MLAVGANLGIYSIVPLYLSKELGLPVGYANTMLGISRLGAIGVAVSCGFLIDRFNLRRVMFLVLIVTGVLTVLMAVTSARHVGIVLFLQAFCVAAFFPAGLLAIAKTFSREMRSLATGVILAMSIVNGGGIIPYLLGLMGDLYSFRIGLLVLGVLVALSSRLVFDLKELE
jgi:MFS transporter, NNP family, nitrate/nitrite transporter